MQAHLVGTWPKISWNACKVRLLLLTTCITHNEINHFLLHAWDMNIFLVYAQRNLYEFYHLVWLMSSRFVAFLLLLCFTLNHALSVAGALAWRQEQH